ncbi:hypothetical protein HanRHA438_Chr02g0051831 [Helianthus annuus]|nr:hypothetical protein HanIR_Chr02g0056571 [Helianthus annuus]KAJ0938621.1 hypothetical protein HanRHA438_Chr02g0051831 [Helianthus annuus]
MFQSVDGVMLARLFPKGILHSVKPFRRVRDGYSRVLDHVLSSRDGLWMWTVVVGLWGWRWSERSTSNSDNGGG